LIVTPRFRSLRNVLKVGAALCFGVASASAAVPNAEKIADAVAETNRLSGRSAPVLLEVTLRIGDGEPVATGVLASHPSGLARLELRSRRGFVERHLLQGNSYTASRNGQLWDPTHPFLPPTFFLQAQSGAEFRAALASYGVASGEVVLGRTADRDCYVFGGRLPRGAKGEERMLPSVWVDMESYQIAQIDRPGGVDPGAELDRSRDARPARCPAGCGSRRPRERPGRRVRDGLAHRPRQPLSARREPRR